MRSLSLKDVTAHLMLLHIMSGVQPPTRAVIDWFERPYVDRLLRLIPDDASVRYPADCRIGYGNAPPHAILPVAQVTTDLIVLSVCREETYRRTQNALGSGGVIGADQHRNLFEGSPEAFFNIFGRTRPMASEFRTES